ncbi:MAG: TlpA family protein disulfide reductase [Desertimonas sp.]
MSNLPPNTPSSAGGRGGPATTNRSRTPLILGIVGVVALALVLGAVLATRGDSDDAAVETTVVETAVAETVVVETAVVETAVAETAVAAETAGAGPMGPAATTSDGDVTAAATSPGAEPVEIDPLAAVVTVTGDDLPPLTDEADDAAVGMTAPQLEGTNYDGEPVSIVPGEGPTLVVFLAHWCPHCNDEIPVLNEWRDSGQMPEGLRVVGVSTAVSNQRPNYPPGEWLASMDWQWDVIADGPVDEAIGGPPAGIAYGVSGFPFFVLLDEDGAVVARGAGEKPIGELQALVAEVIDG